LNQNDHVLISGAGPVGLGLGLGLARAGVRVTVLEAGDDIDDETRTATHLAPTSRLLDSIGALEDAKQAGMTGYHFDFRFPDSGVTIRMDRTCLKGEIPYPYTLHCPRNKLCRIMLEHLRRLSHAEVLFGHRVEQVSQTDTTVTVTAAVGGELRDIEGGWLVGADGARSAVRKALEIKLDGHTWPDRYITTAVHFPFRDHGYGDVNIISDPVDWGVITQIDGSGLWRCAYGEDPNISLPECARRVPEHLAKLVPAPGWKLIEHREYRVHERTAETFRKGRVLLAGDAAHLTQPIGAMGLTSGSLDASHLIRVLSDVIQGRAPDRELDRYAHQRRRVFLDRISPRSIMLKQQVQTADPAARRQVEAHLAAVARDPARMAEMAMFPLDTRGDEVLPKD
jgi:3-(3-hydroxy-phenyl)propionate hydroxylase